MAYQLKYWLEYLCPTSEYLDRGSGPTSIPIYCKHWESTVGCLSTWVPGPLEGHLDFVSGSQFLA